MSQTIVAKRYAEALFQLTEEKNRLNQTVEDLSVVKEVFNSSSQLNSFFKHPSISRENKNNVLEEAFDGVHRDVLNTLKILVNRGRVEVIPSIVDHFIQLVNDKKGIAKADVYSTRELSTLEQNKLKKTFAKRFNKTGIQLNNIVNPSILGGIKVQIGNTIYDGSVEGKLKRIERDIVAANN